MPGLKPQVFQKQHNYLRVQWVLPGTYKSEVPPWGLRLVCAAYSPPGAIALALVLIQEDVPDDTACSCLNCSNTHWN